VDLVVAALADFLVSVLLEVLEQPIKGTLAGPWQHLRLTQMVPVVEVLVPWVYQQAVEMVELEFSLL